MVEEAPPMMVRVAIRKLSGFLFALYAALMLFFLIFGGFDITLAGLHIRLTDLDKPVVIFTFAAVIYLLTREDAPLLKCGRRLLDLLGWPLVALLLAGLAIRLVYLSYTPWDVRTHDVVGHMEYIRLVAETYTLPFRNDCWLCYHPPLYYVISAFYLHLIQGLDVADHAYALQLWSLFLYMIFLTYGLLLIRRYVTDSWLLLLASALLVFWPGGIIHSVRIGNDLLFYALYAAALYHLTLWYQGGDKGLLRAAFLAALTILTKSSGVIVAAIIVVTIGVKFFREPPGTKNIKKTGYAIALLVGAFCLNIAGGVVDSMSHDGKDWLVANSDRLPATLFVGNEPKNYLYFDLRSFLNEPYTSPWDDGKGRQYFWNFLGKTSLFSENAINLGYNRIAAGIMSFLFVVMTLYIVVDICFHRLDDLWVGLIPFLNTIVPIAALMALRIKIPAASSNDFRYILPVILSFVILYVGALARAKRSERQSLEYGGYLLAISFLLATLLFIGNPAHNVWQMS